MRILFSAPEFSHYDSRGSRTFEYLNLYLPLAAFGETRFVPFDLAAANGLSAFEAALRRAVQQFRPDVLVTVPYTNELRPEFLDELRRHTVTVAWFSDDSWRFWNYARVLAPHFAWAVTTYSYMPALYRAHGQPNVIRSQWAANPDVYHPVPREDGNLAPEVSFVGTHSRPRAKIIRTLQRAGIPVAVYGGGWEKGRRASEMEMVRLFGQSKISLALNPAPGRWNLDSLARLFLRKQINQLVPDLHLYANARSWLHRNVPQIKGRHFEIPACGGFLLTSAADDLEAFFEPGKEMVLYEGMDDLVDKVRYYLAHDTEREAIAQAGHARTMEEHTYQKRFEAIFQSIGLV